MNPTQVTQFLHSLRQAYRDLEVDIKQKDIEVVWDIEDDDIVDTSHPYDRCY